ncbi:MAG: molybdopterin-dependent oxidoreductase [Bacteroidetes bacterium]|nr:molybdopterin-dependent oxidoreductase [Bacteroidota bacterium]
MPVHHTFCRICEVLCGLEVNTEDNRVVSIRPDRNHVATEGFACPKGLKQHHLYSSPDRLKYPMKRTGTKWERISWHQALEEIGTKVQSIRREHHPNAVAMYVGTAAGFSTLHPIFAQGFMTGIGSANMFSSSTQDCSNKFAVAGEMYGFPFTQPFPDLTNIKCLVIVGANPMISKWSFLQVPDPGKKLRAITSAGGKIYIVDPRRTETSKITGTHVFIRPGTDLFFYLSFLYEVIHQHGVKTAHVAKHMTGYPKIAKLAEEWPAERTSVVTGIAPYLLRQMVADYLTADGAALYCSTGVNMGAHGTLAFWIQECINAVTGNLNRKGGTLVSKGIIDFPKFGKKHGILTRTARSRVGSCRSVNDAFPGAILADEILTPGREQVRALFVTGGNPLITMPGSERLMTAFKQLDLLVALDIQPTETASLAHYALPCTSPLERPDLPFIFPLMLGLQHRPYLQATRAVIRAAEAQRDESSIYLDLCRYSGIALFGSFITQKLLTLFSKKRMAEGETLREVPQTGIMNLLLRVCGQSSFTNLLKHPHGILRPGHKQDFLPGRIVTGDHKVHLAPALLLEASETIGMLFQVETCNSGKFKLITKRSVTTHNSWTHNYEAFVKAPDNTNYLYMSPSDAANLDLADGDMADVKSETGMVRLPVRITGDIGPLTVALPHGWGHQHSGMQIAKETLGVNVNILAADGPGNIDKVSGMAVLTGIPVDIKPACAPRVTTSWSGKS